MSGMFDRLKNCQEDYLSKGGNFVAFEFWYGRWCANIEGIFSEEELRYFANLLKQPTSKKVKKEYERQSPRLDL